MRSFIIILVTFLSSPLFMYTSCEQGQQGKQQTKVNCQEVNCTEVFVMVSAKVSREGAPVAFDEVYTTRKGSEEQLMFDQGMAPDQYIILDDSYREKLQNSADEFHFIGIKDGEKLVDETYIISADCCHIKKEKGKDSIEL